MTNPKLRFRSADGSLFEDWKSVKVGDIAETCGGGTPATGNASYWGGSIQWLTPTEINTKYVHSSERTITQDGLKNSSAKLLPKGAIVLTTRATLGACSINNFEGDVCTNQGFQSLIGKSSVDSEFLYYLVASKRFQKELEKKASGSTFLEVSPGNLKKIVVALPCKQEQDRIAQFFSTLDEKIGLAERKLTALQTLKSGLIQKIFSREIRFKREDGSNFPDWAEVKMSTMFNSIRNGFVGTIAPFYTTKETGVRYLQGTNIHDGVISDDVEYYVTQEFNQAHRKNILKEDDILMVQSGHVGDCAVVGRYAGSNCHALIVMSNANSQKYSSDFVCYYFHSSKGRKNISLLEKGNTVKHVLASDVAKLQMLLPTIEEQKKVVSVLRQMDAKQALARQELNSLILQKQAFLQQMFV